MMRQSVVPNMPTTGNNFGLVSPSTALATELATAIWDRPCRYRLLGIDKDVETRSGPSQDDDHKARVIFLYPTSVDTPGSGGKLRPSYRGQERLGRSIPLPPGQVQDLVAVCFTKQHSDLKVANIEVSEHASSEPPRHEQRHEGDGHEANHCRHRPGGLVKSPCGVCAGEEGEERETCSLLGVASASICCTAGDS